jgi:hypothetical protein
LQALKTLNERLNPQAISDPCMRVRQRRNSRQQLNACWRPDLNHAIIFMQLQLPVIQPNQTFYLVDILSPAGSRVWTAATSNRTRTGYDLQRGIQMFKKSSRILQLKTCDHTLQTTAVDYR